MSVSATVVAGNFAYGNPASVGEPLGLWAGEANATGDGGGGLVSVLFQPQNPTLTPTLDDQRRQYVYFVDGAVIQANVDPGNLTAECFMHMARSNTALAPRYVATISQPSRDTGSGLFRPAGALIDEGTRRMPIFWDTQELGTTQNTLVALTAELNVNAGAYAFRAYGRYYDRQVIANRSFGRLVSPPPVAPFD